MSQAAERVEQKSFISDEADVVQPPAGSVEAPPSGPVVAPPALLHMPPSPAEEAAGRPGLEGARLESAQLPLPLGEDSEPQPEPAKEKRRRQGSRGFVPVTRDPEVARSYSDNVALDYAIARGLAQALGSLPPEELAALRAKVAKAARRNGKAPSSRPSR